MLAPSDVEVVGVASWCVEVVGVPRSCVGGGWDGVGCVAPETFPGGVVAAVGVAPGCAALCEAPVAVLAPWDVGAREVGEEGVGGDGAAATGVPLVLTGVGVTVAGGLSASTDVGELAGPPVGPAPRCPAGALLPEPPIPAEPFR